MLPCQPLAKRGGLTRKPTFSVIKKNMKKVSKIAFSWLLFLVFGCSEPPSKEKEVEVEKATVEVVASKDLSQNPSTHSNILTSQTKYDNKQSQQQEQKRVNPDEEYSLIGSWERFYTDYASNGEAFRCRKMLTYNSDGSREGFVQREGGKPVKISGTWRYSNNKLNEKDGEGNNVASIITWNSSNAILITYVSVGDKSINEKYSYKRVGTYKVPNRQYATTCGTCDGKKVVPFEVGYDSSCLTSSETQDAMSSSIYEGEGTVRVWVRCCTCLGKGVVSKSY